MADTGDRPVVIYRARELYEAEALRLALEAEGIPSRVEGEYLTGVLGDVPLGSTTSPRVVVGADDEAAARTILSRLRQQRGQPAGDEEPCCLSCGVAMTQSAVCPSCGWTYQTEPSCE